MRYINNICFLALVILMMSGCFRERIELDLNTGENKKVVVQAWLTNLDEEQYVKINYSGDYFDSLNVEYIENAQVFIKYDNEAQELIYRDRGRYYAPQGWRAVEGKEYSLEIEHEGNQYTAKEMMRVVPELENLRSILVEIDDDGKEIYGLFFDFWETPGEGDGYYGIDYHKGSPLGDTITNGGFINDDFVDGLYLENLSIENFGYSLGDTVILEVHSVGIEATNYLQDIEVEIFREGIFDPTPVNVRSNISNGAVGYFIVSGARRIEYVMSQ